MDEQAVRAHAEAHGRAVVEGNLRRASTDLAGPAQSQAASVMQRLPEEISGAEVVTVEVGRGACVVRTRYMGGADAVTVESRWEERDGRPVIVELSVV